MNLANLRRVFSYLDAEYDADGVTLRKRIDQAREYVDNHTHRADLVSELPTNAPRGYLLVTAGDPNLYVGTGMTTPLRRIPTQALP